MVLQTYVMAMDHVSVISVIVILDMKELIAQEEHKNHVLMIVVIMELAQHKQVYVYVIKDGLELIVQPLKTQIVIALIIAVEKEDATQLMDAFVTIGNKYQIALKKSNALTIVIIKDHAHLK